MKIVRWLVTIYIWEWHIFQWYFSNILMICIRYPSLFHISPGISARGLMYLPQRKKTDIYGPLDAIQRRYTKQSVITDIWIARNYKSTVGFTVNVSLHNFDVTKYPMYAIPLMSETGLHLLPMATNNWTKRVIGPHKRTYLWYSDYVIHFDPSQVHCHTDTK